MGEPHVITEKPVMNSLTGQAHLFCNLYFGNAGGLHKISKELQADNMALPALEATLHIFISVCHIGNSRSSPCRTDECNCGCRPFASDVVVRWGLVESSLNLVYTKLLRSFYRNFRSSLCIGNRNYPTTYTNTQTCICC